jgi:phosphopantothenoylcysteine decarboxylase / phosphopantothenate---cysteine ligase
MRKDRDVDMLGSHLDGKDIGLFITSGIAAYKTPQLARHFRQYGANVQVYITPEGSRYVGLDALEWASLNPVITKLSPKAEHLADFDAYVVAPATLNTINKIAHGIADNAVTSTIASAFGKLQEDKSHPIMIAPAMHGSLESNPAYKHSIEYLKNYGVKIIDPIHKWGKANFPSSHEVVAPTIREMSKSPLKGKSVLVTAGPTPVPIDDVRFITNKFKGRLGIKIAEEAYLRGADVKLVMGPGGLSAPSYIAADNIKNFDQYYEKVMGSLESKKFDAGIFSAAVADYRPKEVAKGKIPSGGKLKSIPMTNTVKVIDSVRKSFPGLYMVTFKYETNIMPEELERIANSRINKGYDMVVANRGEEMNDTQHHSIIVDKNGIVSKPKTKDENARMILDALESRL